MPAELLSPGRVIRLTAAMIRRDAEVFLLLALLLAGLPAWLAGMLVPPPPVDAEGRVLLDGAALMRGLWANGAVVVLNGMLQVILIHRAWSAEEGRPAPLRDSVSQVLRLFPLLLGLMLLEGLAVGLGLALLVVPGLLLLCCWAVSLPVLAVESAGPAQALRRSTEMTRGHRWAVLTLGVAFVGLNAAVLMLGWLLTTLLLLSGPLAALAVLVTTGTNAALSVLNGIGMTALYRELGRIGPAG